MTQDCEGQGRDQTGFTWRIEVSRNWDVLGPFPIHAREQHYLTPSFPLNLGKPYHHERRKTWTSHYADNAEVSWSKATADTEGNLSVSFPDIRWENLRKMEGWAALQHHSVLRTNLTVYPPKFITSSHPPPICVNLSQGSYFTIVPRPDADTDTNEEMANCNVPEWHAGNIYNLHRAPLSFVNLPGKVSLVRPNVYDLFVSGDYEIRVFGDPEDKGQAMPVLQITLRALPSPVTRSNYFRFIDHDILPTFVDGYAFGDAIGVGLQAIDDWLTVTRVEMESSLELPEGMELSLLRKVVIAPTQTRIIPIRIQQSKPFKRTHLDFILVTISSKGGRGCKVSVRMEIRHAPMWRTGSYDHKLEATYFSATSHPTAFLAKPPYSNPGKQTSHVLSLHGAGDDVVEDPYWADVVRRQERSWIIMPTGRTEWGLDWHGSSASETFAAHRALSEILDARYRAWSFDPDSKVTLVGHSNGAQGVWYLASRYPDRVRAAVAASAYIKSQAYVPLTHSRASHYIDPSLCAILESSLTPDDNDLYMSNVAHKAILAIHGGIDTNVPTWHSREYFSAVKNWGEGRNIKFREDKGKSHWYPGILDNAEVQQFFDNHLNTPESLEDVREFTLRVANPAQSHSLYGWGITETRIPGRLAHIHVRIIGDKTHISLTNVQSGYCVFNALGSQNTIYNEGSTFHPKQGTVIVFSNTDGSMCTMKFLTPSNKPDPVSPRGRIQNVLDTPAPFTLVIPNPADHPQEFSVALRIAHILNVYHKLDAEIVTDDAALSLLNSNVGSRALDGNIIIVAHSKNAFGSFLLERNETEFWQRDDGWSIKGRHLKGPGLGLVFSHPHPLRVDGLVLFLGATDEEGLERALRLFPFRTGVAVPDWVVVGRIADKAGAAGVIGAGVWNNQWKWNEAMSWLY